MGFQVSKLNSTCIKCGKPVKKGDRIWWTLEARGLEHAECHGPEPETSSAKRKVVPHQHRCVQTKELFGSVMRCEKEVGHKSAHSYHFTVAMGRKLLNRIDKEPLDSQLTLGEILEPKK
jgi:hypothetical protein